MDANASSTEKKALAKLKNDFALHVALIMRSTGEAKNAATFRAWCEGQGGLNTRLNIPPAPPKVEQKEEEETLPPETPPVPAPGKAKA